MLPDRPISLGHRGRIVVLLMVSTFVLVTLAIKAFNFGWFEAHNPLPLNGSPAFVFFIVRQGCQCQMAVMANAEAQIATWDALTKFGVPLLRVDLDRRPDLGRQYNVARAPALVLLNAQGYIAWKQDVGVSDEAPLNLTAAEKEIADLLE